ncbi:sodium:solute symporter family protein [Brevibacillus sp. NRS-1366]|uniref:sodium:solute symporter family protein n=1 Tax=Brevibacillus sp. NRS-1366 TaxID=3233899 RepID=UPI003D1CE17A
MNAAIVIIFGFLLLSLVLGIRARQGHTMDMEQWAIGGRGFSKFLVFILLAGETYSVFTLLGTSGFAYANGPAAFYTVAFTTLGMITSYWLLPPVWRYAKKHQIISMSELFSKKYKSAGLGIFVTVIGVVALIPYIVVLFKSMGILVSATSYGSISPQVAIWIGMIVLVVYVLVSGIHGSAWNAIIKDILIFFVILFLGIYLPFKYYGGIQSMFEAVHLAKPNFMMFPESGKSMSWFLSTIAISTFGYFMWPHNAPVIFSAKNERAFRFNAVVFPLYALMVLFVCLVGYTAAIQIPGLKGGDTDFALLNLSMKSFDPWFVGIIGATGLLATLIPGSMMLISASTMLTKNFFFSVFPNVNESKTPMVAKVFVIVLSMICTLFALLESSTLVTLYLTAYAMVIQLAPSLYFSFTKNNPITKQGAFAGITLGIGFILYTSFAKVTMITLFPTMPKIVQDLNIGVLALVINIVTMCLVSVLTKKTANISTDQSVA